MALVRSFDLRLINPVYPYQMGDSTPLHCQFPVPPTALMAQSTTITYGSYGYGPSPMAVTYQQEASAFVYALPFYPDLGIHWIPTAIPMAAHPMPVNMHGNTPHMTATAMPMTAPLMHNPNTQNATVAAAAAAAAAPAERKTIDDKKDAQPQAAPYNGAYAAQAFQEQLKLRAVKKKFESAPNEIIVTSTGRIANTLSVARDSKLSHRRLPVFEEMQDLDLQNPENALPYSHQILNAEASGFLRDMSAFKSLFPPRELIATTNSPALTDEAKIIKPPTKSLRSR